MQMWLIWDVFHAASEHVRRIEGSQDECDKNMSGQVATKNSRLTGGVRRMPWKIVFFNWPSRKPTTKHNTWAEKRHSVCDSRSMTRFMSSLNSSSVILVWFRRSWIIYLLPKFYNLLGELHHSKTLIRHVPQLTEDKKINKIKEICVLVPIQ